MMARESGASEPHAQGGEWKFEIGFRKQNENNRVLEADCKREYSNGTKGLRTNTFIRYGKLLLLLLRSQCRKQSIK